MQTKWYYYLLVTSLIYACASKQPVDLIVKGARIYTIDSAMSVVEVLVINKGKIIAVGDENLLKQYNADNIVDATGKFIYPGLIDAHSHFYGLGSFKQTVDLTGTKSWDEVIERCKKFVNENNPTFLTGRGWDQNDWTVKEFPDNTLLNQFNIPVLLKRVDGHAAIANQVALALTSISEKTKVEGGEIVMKNNKLTGILIDNAVDLVQEKLPKRDRNFIIQSLLAAQDECFENGLTSVCDAGLETDIIQIIDSLQQVGLLKMRIYAMVSVSDENINYWLGRKQLKTNFLNVSSFKMYGDGALGSRGACLLKPYSDKHSHYGMILTPFEKMEEYVKRISESNFQLNTHCIGDSANRYVLNLYNKYLGENNQRRWRIEHAQVVDENDFALFKQYNIIPSVQPTHATSDMYWAEERLGKTRIKNAYALKKLLAQNGWLPLGTDFPVESVNPFYTFYAAVARQDAQEFPQNGFQKENALTREEALKGMTIWAAKAAFEENEKGSLETGKFADFIMLDTDLLSDDLKKIRETKPTAVYVSGVKVNK